jgi:octaprenyl-diphosphate synthase
MSTAVSTSSELKSHIQRLLRSDLEAVERILQMQFRNPGQFIQEVAQHVARFQGKRIRPIVALLSAQLTGATSEQMQRAQTFAAVVEMIHSATLVHDDVIDDADLRRHVATIHRRWNTETSVLFGDYLFSRAFHLAATTGDADACRLIGHATSRTCEGELNQIAARLEQSESERDYFRIVAGKTGHLFAVSSLLGARASHCSRELQWALRRYGLRLGLAFQIADDVLDLTESADRTGKDAANDLANRRLTLPILRALKLAEPDERVRIHRLLLSGDPADQQRLRHEPVLRAGIDSALRTARSFVARALQCLDGFPDTDARRALMGLAEFAIERST